MGAESSKIVHQFSTGTSISGVTCMGWTSNVANKKSSSVKQTKISAWQHHFSEGNYASKGKAALDLPRDLAMIDVEISLPKLSVLANGGSS